MSSEEQAPMTARKPARTFARGAFPRVSLAEALPLVEAIRLLGHGEEVRRRTVFSQLGRSPDSGTSQLLIAAANRGYGLVTGSSSSEYLGVTKRGIQAVAGPSEAERRVAIHEALFENPIFSAFVSHFNDRPMPIDEVAIDNLQREHGLSPEDAKTAWKVFSQNMQDFGLVQELSGKKIVISRETAVRSLAEPVSTEQDAPVAASAPSTKASSELPRSDSVASPEEIIPQIHLNVQIVLPENASPETYDAIFASIAVHLLRRAR